MVVPNRKDRRVDAAGVGVVGVVGLDGIGNDDHAAVATTRESSSKILSGVIIIFGSVNTYLLRFGTAQLVRGGLVSVSSVKRCQVSSESVWW
mmetsp:Transcript_9367/g.16640  ORF Transcript_9367/g.16640 Transcript_9367/m.16640 type:complete len:92 (+) Transcript_9367:716-991(+)